MIPTGDRDVYIRAAALQLMAGGMGAPDALARAKGMWDERQANGAQLDKLMKGDKS